MIIDRKLKSILTKRLIRFLNEQSMSDDKKFTEFYDDYKLYFKEAITRSTDQAEKVTVTIEFTQKT
jgi:TNF receptor-associated protein 1